MRGGRAACGRESTEMLARMQKQARTGRKIRCRPGALRVRAIRLKRARMQLITQPQASQQSALAAQADE